MTLTRRRLLQVSGCAGALFAAGGLDAEAQAPPEDPGLRSARCSR